MATAVRIVSGQPPRQHKPKHESNGHTQEAAEEKGRCRGWRAGRDPVRKPLRIEAANALPTVRPARGITAYL